MTTLAQAEEGLIYCALSDVRALRAIDGIVADDILSPEARETFEAIHRAQAKGVFKVKYDGFDESGLDVSAGTAEWLSTLSVRAFCNPRNAPYFAGIIREASAQRDVAGLCHRFSSMHEAGEPQPLDELLSALRKRVDRSTVGPEGCGPAELSSLMESEYDRAATRGTEIPGLPTGLRALDRLAGGLRPSQLWIAAGRPGTGKSALALVAALHVGVTLRRRVAFFSFEMSASEIVARVAAGLGRFNSTNYEAGRLNDAELAQLNRARAAVAESGLRVFDGETPTLAAVSTRVRRLAWDAALDLVILDYLQLMRGSGAKGQNRENEIAEISRGLKALAMETRTPIVALSQLNREVENRAGGKPRLSDLRESGAIEQDANLVLLLHRPDLTDPKAERNVAELLVAKNRSGRTGAVRLRWVPEQTRFEDYDP
ncbi:MAG: AAA family ATPase [Deltaproteobacteria bacterium]|nr:AAA family ATPase [Deltaproteobacteria bacterium]